VDGQADPIVQDLRAARTRSSPDRQAKVAAMRALQLLCGHTEIYETAQPNNQAFEAEKLSNIQ
jgi:hypothetical protein